MEKIIDELRHEIAQRERQIEWLLKHEDKLKNVPEIKTYFGGFDFDNLPHKRVLAVIRALGGRWTKSVTPGQNDKVDYAAEIDGMRVRCWAGQPPPSCKIVEVEEIVPAQPETKRMVKKLVCPKSVKV